MSSKTPFEIRLEVLKMAKEMLEQDYYTEKEQLINLWHAQVGRAHDMKEEIPPAPVLPSFPGTSDIIKKAKELNSFISNA